MENKLDCTSHGRSHHPSDHHEDEFDEEFVLQQIREAGLHSRRKGGNGGAGGGGGGERKSSPTAHSIEVKNENAKKFRRHSKPGENQISE
jgi:hypothetical protein